MEDDFKYFCKWKTTSNTFVNGRRPLIFCEWKRNLKYIFVHGRQPQITLIENDSMIPGMFTLWVKIQNKI